MKKLKNYSISKLLITLLLRLINTNVKKRTLFFFLTSRVLGLHTILIYTYKAHVLNKVRLYILYSSHHKLLHFLMSKRTISTHLHAYVHTRMHTHTLNKLSSTFCFLHSLVLSSFFNSCFVCCCEAMAPSNPSPLLSLHLSQSCISDPHIITLSTTTH